MTAVGDWENSDDYDDDKLDCQQRKGCAKRITNEIDT